MYRAVKRVADVLAAAVLLLVLSPLLLLIMLCLAFTASGQVFFLQTRAGRDGRPFTIVKFCTMRPEAPHAVPTGALTDPARWITPIGRVLRGLSLDELPQLWNILKGDMSFVGPRPVILRERALLAARRRRGADTVRPGLTGWAQVQGRDFADPEQKAAYDGYYVRHMSFWLDVKILLLTVLFVVQREDGGGTSRSPSGSADSSRGKATGA